MNQPLIKVLASPAFYNKKSNPYNYLIYSEMDLKNIFIDEFSFKKCLKLDYDLIHIHWPEIYLNSHYLTKAFFNTFMMLLCIKWAKFKGKKLVWTVHNVEPHEIKYFLLNRIMWKIFTPMVDAIISLSKANEKIINSKVNFLSSTKRKVIYHGLYSDVYSNEVSRSDARAKIGIAANCSVCLFFGQVKKYKNIEKLIDIYFESKENELLLIVGKFESVEYYNDIIKKTEGNKNIIVKNNFVEENDIQYFFNSSDVCVIPFQQIFNSGSVLLSVSFGVPVIVPDSENFTEYKNLFENGMINTYSDDLTQEDIAKVANKTDFKIRWKNEQVEWSTIRDKHAEIYKELLINDGLV
jgi:glycosyltransferase involved in cell wall biosynthesis